MSLDKDSINEFLMLYAHKRKQELLATLEREAIQLPKMMQPAHFIVASNRLLARLDADMGQVTTAIRLLRSLDDESYKLLEEAYDIAVKAHLDTAPFELGLTDVLGRSRGWSAEEEARVARLRDEKQQRRKSAFALLERLMGGFAE